MRLRVCCVRFVLIFIFVSANLPGIRAQAAAKPWPVKIVIITTFEIGADTGDRPGEFQFWVEREHLGETVPFPGGVRPLRSTADHSVVGMVTGTTLINAAASVMALGLDPRFDLTHAYWLVTGIAGVDPADASLGSAAWARYVVNDVAREIDPREAPANWPYGLFALGAKEPDTLPEPRAIATDENGFPLNAGLAEWAYELTRNLKLKDTPELQAARAKWAGYENAQRPPFVLLGDSFASDYYWHGKIMTAFANSWVQMWTHGLGNFVMTNMEDSAVAGAMKRLDAMHRVDYRRLMVLRTGSNYSMQAPGHTAVESVTAAYAGYLPSLESAYAVGSVVTHELLDHWTRYETQVPSTRTEKP